MTTMPVLTLSKLAVQCAIKHVRDITDLGDAPFKLVEPIILKIDNAQQLKELEEKCPQFRGEDRAVWQALIKRDIPNSEDYEPKNPLNWSRLYFKLYREWEKEIQSSSQALAKSLGKINEEKEKHQMTFSNKISNRGGSNPSHLRRERPKDAMHIQGRTILDKARKEAKAAKSIMNRGLKRAADGSPRPVPQQQRTIVMSRSKPNITQAGAPLSSTAADTLRSRKAAENASASDYVPQSQPIQQPVPAPQRTESPPLEPPSKKRRPPPSVFMPPRKRT